MTIVYILNSTDTTAGSTKSFLTLLAGVRQRGVYPIVVVPDANELCEQLSADGIETIVLTYRPSTYSYHGNLQECLLFPLRQSARLWCNYRASSSLYHRLKGRNIDIIHTNVSLIDIGLRAAQMLKVPHVYHFREYADLDFQKVYFPSPGWFHRHLRATGSYSICITRDIQRHHGLADDARSKVIYNGIFSANRPLEVRAQSDEQHDDIDARGSYFLYAGRIEPTKGLFPLIRAYVRYVEQIKTEADADPLPLKVAGDCIAPLYMQEIKGFIEQHNIEPYIQMLGRCTEMSSLYAGARALIVPSEFEGFGRCMPEAMYCGCLVVGHNTGGTQEQFDNGIAHNNGQPIGFSYETEDQLTKHIIYLHNAPIGELDRIRRRAFDTVAKLYSTEQNVENTYRFYQQMLEKTKGI